MVVFEVFFLPFETPLVRLCRNELLLAIHGAETGKEHVRLRFTIDFLTSCSSSFSCLVPAD